MCVCVCVCVRARVRVYLLSVIKQFSLVQYKHPERIKFINMVC